MKIIRVVTIAALGLIGQGVSAQESVPAGFTKGTIRMANGNVVSGFIKETIRKEASLTYLESAGGKKQQFHGAAIAGAEIGDIKFLCRNGDFFKVICEGDLYFLQKASDASAKPVYNGSEVSFSSGTDGRIGDYFIFNATDGQLERLSSKRMEAVIATCFAGSSEAAEKARAAGNNPDKIKEAVVIYNNRSK